MERNRPFEFLSRATSSQNPFIHESEYNANANGRGRSDASINTAGIMKKGPEKPVGLNLVTDFSLPRTGIRDEAPEPAFVDLNDLKMLSKEREKERSTQKIRDVIRKRTFHGFHRLPDGVSIAEGSNSFLDPHDRPSPSKKVRDELSPSDRPIMIGYTVPYDESSGTQTDRAKELDSAGSHATPLTPSIIVTPAREDSFWSGPSSDYRRPRSSVYSQPTPHIVQTGSDIPPVPAIPVLHRDGNGISDLPQIESGFSTRNRSLSTGTVFEEDASPRLRRLSRSDSDENLRTPAQRQSVNSFVNKHQSQGWWTYLLSPLLGRSNTVTSRKTETPTSAEQPPLPSVLTTSTEWWEKEVSSFSPDTPEAAVASRGFNFGAVDNHPRKNSYDTNEYHPVEYGVASVMFPGGQVQGAAAEYYQACAHELFSGRPYFECINHVCSITPRDKINAAVPDAHAQSAEGSRGLALLDVDVPSESTNPFVEPSKPRGHFSGSTAVNDENDNPFETSKGIKAIEESTEESPKAASPKTASPTSREKGLPKAPEPTLLYPPEKQASSQHQPVTVAPAPYIHFPSNPSHPEPSTAQAAREVPRPITVFPGTPPPVQSPGAPSPGLQQSTERGGSIPMSKVHESPAPAYGSNENSHPFLPPRSDQYPISRPEIVHPATESQRVEIHRRRLEREDAMGRKAGGLWRGRGPVSKKGCFGRPGREGRLRRRWYLGIAAFFLIIVILAVVLATTLTRKGDETPVESRWLNLTGYPPMPTGIATIAGPEPQVQNSGCIVPSTLWSCALPKEQQEVNKPYPADQPNFRVAIRFRNGTYENSTTVSDSARLRRRDNNDLFKPSPAPPSIADQTFLGNATDKNSEPYAGEETPFYITLLSPIKLSSSHLCRRAGSSSLFPNISALFPAPDEGPDGTAAPALLYPLPESQPIRLYNRGQPTEHYGFYTYFDRSIFLDSSAPLTGQSEDTNPADENGGSKKENARVRCTWAQTRFLVQVWTQPTRSGMVLLQDTPESSTATAPATPTPTPSSSTSTNSNSSATNFTRPGSFPYPVTITMDRHGGNAKQKMVYCYGLEDTSGHFNATEKKLQIEDRGVGGTLVNPAPGIFNNTGEVSVLGRRGEGGDEKGAVFDGGSGGCSCLWRNWVKEV